MLKSTIKLFLVLLTLTVAVIGWIMGRYRDPDYLILILVLISATLLTFIVMNIHDSWLQARKRKERESGTQVGKASEAGKVKRSDSSFALRERKSGLSWGGGNIKASEATRGTRRKFLGR